LRKASRSAGNAGLRHESDLVEVQEHREVERTFIDEEGEYLAEH
jgi:hypothetical protein